MALVDVRFNMIEQLPPDPMVFVLQFLDVASRVKLAFTNKLVQKRVFKECPAAWSVIDFGHVDFDFRGKLTDFQLSRLLIRVNAREVTTKLSLVHCSDIQGSGLAPLTDSRVLEHLNLHDTKASFAPTPCISVLFSMVPHKLFDVRMSLESDVAKQFYGYLRFAKSKQAIVNRSRCTCCSELVLDSSRQLVGGAPVTHCLECGNEFCRRPSCPMDVRQCIGLHTSSCQSCGQLKPCNDCGRSYCAELCEASIRSCTKCGRESCTKCSIIRKCGRCRTALCNGCTRFRHVCNKPTCQLLCSGCQDRYSCAVCHTTVCYCSWDRMPVKCSSCLKVICSPCRLNLDRMERSKHFATCSGCGKTSCKNCVTFVVCQGCNKSFCGSSRCYTSIRKCGECLGVFCGNCRKVESCVECKASFCVEHDGIFQCTACKQHVCFGCMYTTHGCEFCGAECCDECMCEELDVSIEYDEQVFVPRQRHAGQFL